MPKKFRETAKSEMDSQRALLDSLMGINRNEDREEDEVRDYRDDRVCKFHLTGMCPADIFVNTKMDEGPCDKHHSEALKEEFMSSKDQYMYDNLLEREFSNRITDADRAIKRGRQRIEDDSAEDQFNPDISPQVIRLNGEIVKYISESEKAINEGDIDRAQEIVTVHLEDILKDKSNIMSKLAEDKKVMLQKARQSGQQDNTKKLRVCDVCGSFLSIFDSDKRLSDHFLGKQHIGYLYMRDTLAAIKKRKEERRASGDDERDRDRDRDRGGERDRYSSRDGDRDRDRDRGRDSGRDRDYGRGRDDRDRDRDRGGRDRDRYDDRDRDRGRGRDDRDRGRDDRDRGRDRGNYGNGR